MNKEILNYIESQIQTQKGLLRAYKLVEMALDVQVHILSVDTGDFYSNKEARLHWLNHKLRVERNNLKKKENEIVDTLLGHGLEENDLEDTLREMGL